MGKQRQANQAAKTRWKWCALGALLAVAGSGARAPAQPVACRYDVSAVLTAPSCGLGGVATIGTAISPDGTTVVGYRFCLGAAKPWMWTQASGLVMLNLPPWLTEATPLDVNDNQIMVGEGVGTQAGTRGFVCNLQTMIWTELLPQNPPTGWSGANAISNNNVVVGFRSIDDGGDPVTPRTAFRWSSGVFTDLGLIDGFSTNAVDVNELGDVSVSTGLTSVGFYARVWTGSGLINVGPVPRGVSSNAGRLANNGEMLTSGIVQQSPVVTRPFVFRPSDGGFAELPLLPDATGGGGRRFGDDGSIIGDCSYPGAGSPRRAAIWVNFNPIDVTMLVEAGVGFLTKEGIGITQSGLLLCNGNTTTQGNVSFLLQPVWASLGDTNCDQRVDVDDLIQIILHWGPCRACPSDLNGNGLVDVDDFIEVILNWSP